MLDRGAFCRPIAHRGLHNTKKGIVENTAPAFEAAIRHGYGIECDLRPAAGGLPIVFHDETLNRLVEGRGSVARLSASDLKRMTYKKSDVRISTLAELLDLAGGAVPLLIEVKSEWRPPDKDFLGAIAKQAQRYRGPLALMSFDPAVMAALKILARWQKQCCWLLPPVGCFGRPISISSSRPKYRKLRSGPLRLCLGR